MKSSASEPGLSLSFLIWFPVSHKEYEHRTPVKKAHSCKLLEDIINNNILNNHTRSNQVIKVSSVFN